MVHNFHLFEKTLLVFGEYLNLLAFHISFSSKLLIFGVSLLFLTKNDLFHKEMPL